jgi:hypothetical protein
MLNVEEVEKIKIIEAYSAVFLNSDARQWNKVQSFVDTVHLDYTSLGWDSKFTCISIEIIS